jgi:hypothetical protein
LHNIDRPSHPLIKFYPEVAREMINDQVSAIERVQNQDLLNRSLSRIQGRAGKQTNRERDPKETATRAPPRPSFEPSRQHVQVTITAQACSNNHNNRTRMNMAADESIQFQALKTILSLWAGDKSAHGFP